MEYLSYNQNLKIFSRGLRCNLTDAEKLLWLKIRRKQVNNYQFFRQKPIGKYIVDFYCKDCNLIIEIDGGQHCEDKYITKDKLREKYLNSLGLKVIRFSNLDILKNVDNVLIKIAE